jgi:hypothetical protein
MMPGEIKESLQTPWMDCMQQPPLEPQEQCLTATEIAERLKLNKETVRRLFLHEPGVIIICTPRKGRRVYRTLRIPEHVFQRVLTRLMRVA